jgi:hypothetical protein
MTFSKLQVIAYGLLMAATVGLCTVAIHARIPTLTYSQLALSNARLSDDPYLQTKQIKAEIERIFGPLEVEIPGAVEAMINIADCESYGGRDGMLMHIDPDGVLVANPKSSAAGVFQVLLYTHQSDYAAMGLNPIAVLDNIYFARELVLRRHQTGHNPYKDWECAPD